METIKEEKKADLEQLLNSLVKLGWKPYGISRVKNVTLLNRYVSFSKRTILGIEFFEYTLRSLVSKESFLWQFVCENGMVKRTPTMWERYNADTGKKYGFYDDHSTYRLIETSLKNEDELEQFLLNNIIINEQA